MSARLYAVLALASLLAVGCRQDPQTEAYLESLRAEKLWLEDKVYDLQSKYQQQLAELEKYRQENVALRQQLGDEPPAERQAARPAAEPPPLDIELGVPDQPADSSALPQPDAALVPPAEATVQQALFAQTGREQPELEPAPAAAEPGGEPESAPPDLRVTHIVLDPLGTSGHDFDHAPGDDGIIVLVQPRNADDQYVPVPGEIAVVVLDPALSGEAARVARWDLDRADVAERLAASRAKAAGIRLVLPWPDKPPVHSRLHVFVRYTTEDGRQLEADRQILVGLPGQFSHRWTPKSRPASRRGQMDVPAVVSDGGQRSLDDYANPASHAVATASATAGGETAGRPEPPAAKRAGRRRPQWSPWR